MQLDGDAILAMAIKTVISIAVSYKARIGRRGRFFPNWEKVDLCPCARGVSGRACHTQEEIAGSVEVPRETIRNWEDEFGQKLATDNWPNPPDFTPPLYNVWKQQDKSNKVDHFGNSEPRWLAIPKRKSRGVWRLRRTQ